MVAADNAQLEHCVDPELLGQMRDRERNNARRHTIRQLARTLVDSRRPRVPGQQTSRRQ
jgi:hypothetical protein